MYIALEIQNGITRNSTPEPDLVTLRTFAARFYPRQRKNRGFTLHLATVCATLPHMAKASHPGRSAAGLRLELIIYGITPGWDQHHLQDSK